MVSKTTANGNGTREKYLRRTRSIGEKQNGCGAGEIFF